MVKKTGDIMGNKNPDPKPELATIAYYTIVILIICAVLRLLGFPI